MQSQNRFGRFLRAFVTFGTTTMALHGAVTIEDLSKHGVCLLGPTSSEFQSVRAALGRSEVLDVLAPVSILLQNRTGRTMVAYSVRWKCVDVAGKVTFHNQTFNDIRRLSTGVEVIAGSSAVVSPLFAVLSNSEVRRMNALNNRVHEARATADRFNLQREVSIILDFALFDDGSWIGPAEGDGLAILAGQLESERLMVEQIVQFRVNRASPQVIETWLRARADEAARANFSARVGTIDWKSMYVRQHAEQLLSRLRRTGIEDVYETVRKMSEVKSVRPLFKKQ